MKSTATTLNPDRSHAYKPITRALRHRIIFFLKRFAATQLARQVHQERTQVV